MTSRYSIADTCKIITPALIVFRDLVEQNLQTMLQIAGEPDRLRPHCKTHKMAAVTQMELGLGITKHKCATLAEAEMLAEAGVRDIVLAYNIVGPNIARVAAFRRKYPAVEFAVTADHPAPVKQLSDHLASEGLTAGVMLDVDAGMHRTGIAPGEAAVELYRQIADSPGLKPAGIHAYDGHHHEHDPGERAAAIDEDWRHVESLREMILAHDLPIPKIVAIELSPGTTVFHDAGSVHNYADLPFTPAALVLTRVISLPGEHLITFDVGSKGIASDPPVQKRAMFPNLPDAEIVSQNEEHLIVRTKRADEFSPGDEQLVIPWHVCPTSAMHKQAYVVSGGKLVDHWPVTARDRQLSI